jgi:hypothetical protein
MNPPAIRHSSAGTEHSLARRVRTAAAATIAVGGAVFLGGAATLITASAHSFGSPATSAVTTGTSSGAAYLVGTAVMKDSASLAAGVTSDRTINFFLWPPSTSTCGGTPVFTDSVHAVSGPASVETATAYTGKSPQAPEVAGTYQWTANIEAPSGAIEDTSKCGDEPVALVAKPAPVVGGGGVQGIATPVTGAFSAITGVTVGGAALLLGLGMTLVGASVRRRQRI